jgi:phosphoribosylformylglycinamidine cyclo-ligase
MGLEPSARLPGLRRSLGDELLRVHPNYQPALASLPSGMLKGAAHITGGGLTDNLPRILPPGCDAVIDAGSWKIPPIFGILQAGGKVPMEEMFQVFNMGIGMTAIVSERDSADALRLMKGARRIGRIEPGTGKTRFEMASGK